MEKATFGAGCFWGVEALFRRTPGVIETQVGYAGGTSANPTYQDVCTDRTGHAEVVALTFDPRRVTYSALLDIFFAHHDPTTRNRQGPDIGSQYRSVIFWHSPEQKALALAAVARHASRFKRRIVTEITPAPPFFAAEEYHQRYLEKRGLAQCHLQPTD